MPPFARRTRFPWALADLRAQWDSLSVAGDGALEEARVVPRPSCFSLGVGLTDRCNLDCPMCWWHAPDGPERRKAADLPLERLERILRAVGPLRQVIFAAEGEPLLHPRFFEAAELAQEHAEAISLATNGIPLSRESVARLAEMRVAALVLSCDAADAEGYARFRRGGDFSVFRGNAALLAKAFGERVILHAVICAQNARSLAALPALADDLGIASIGLAGIRMHPRAAAEGLSPASPEDLPACLEAMGEEADRCGIRLILDERLADAGTMGRIARMLPHPHVVPPPAAPGSCLQPWSFATVTAGGELLPCCGDIAPEPILSDDFDGVFNHESLVLLRALLQSGCVPPACARCRHEPGHMQE